MGKSRDSPLPTCPSHLKIFGRVNKILLQIFADQETVDVVSHFLCARYGHVENTILIFYLHIKELHQYWCESLSNNTQSYNIPISLRTISHCLYAVQSIIMKTTPYQDPMMQ